MNNNNNINDEELTNLPEYWWDCWLVNPIKQGDLLAIQRYLDRQPEGLSAECPNYYDPFVVAAQQQHPAALRLLLEHWAVHPTPDAPPPNERGLLLFNEACAHGALETARYLLDEQPTLVSLHAFSRYGRTPILNAAESLVSCAKDEANARLDAQTAHDRVQRSEALVGLLLDRGACARDTMSCTRWEISSNPKLVDGDESIKDTVLSLAIARAGPALLRRLIDEGADALATTYDFSHDIFRDLFRNYTTPTKLTLLHLAAFYGNYQGVQVLAEHYAQRGLDIADAVACRDQFGRLPIHYAAAGWPGAARHGPDSDSDSDSTITYTGADTIALLRILTDSGNPRLSNAPDQYSDTPLHHAVSPNLITHRAAFAVARFLCINLHASARLHGRNGETPLHRLCHSRPHHPSSSIDTRLVALLLDLDEDQGLAADVNALDDAGNTPLHLAARCLAHVPAAAFLLARGADVRTRNKRGRTPLHEAAGGRFGFGVPTASAENIPAQDAMLAVLCGRSAEEEGLALEKNWNALMDEEDADGKTPRQIAGETRAAWREEEAERAKPRTRGRGRGRGRGA